jgi:hypothetical protein
VKLLSRPEMGIMSSKWIEFQDVEKHGFKRQKLPPERKDVLCKLKTNINENGGVAVGYLRYAAGDKKSPFFVCSAIPGPWEVTHWCDCLPESFAQYIPGWKAPSET